MKRLAIVAVLALTSVLVLVPRAAAQDDNAKEHFAVGVFADYVRLHNANNANFWGLGGRVGFGLAPHASLEAEMAYDFEKQFTQTFSGGGTTTFTQSNGLRLLHGTFGPKFFVGSKHVQAFVVLKGGFLNFNVSGQSPISGFTGAVSNIPSGDTNGVFYPGGGFKVSAGPIGFRVEAGDLMYFDNGANHNLAVKFGPEFTF